VSASRPTEDRPQRDRADSEDARNQQPYRRAGAGERSPSPGRGERDCVACHRPQSDHSHHHGDRQPSRL